MSEIKKVTAAEKSSGSELQESEIGQIVGGAFNAFLNFGDVKGESTDKDHKDWVSVLSYNHTVTAP